MQFNPVNKRESRAKQENAKPNKVGINQQLQKVGAFE